MKDAPFNPRGEASNEPAGLGDYQLDDSDKLAIIRMLQTNRESCIEEITRYQMAIEFQEVRYQQILAQEKVVASL